MTWCCLLSNTLLPSGSPGFMPGSSIKWLMRTSRLRRYVASEVITSNIAWGGGNMSDSFPFPYAYVAVPCRNLRLFRRIFQSHRCLRSAISLSFCEGQGSHELHRFIRHSCIYEAHMSSILNRSSAIRHFKHSNVIGIRNGITFGFYTRLSHFVAMPTREALVIFILPLVVSSLLH